MAHHHAKPLSLLFLVGLFLFVSLRVEARESKHFSKATHSHHRQPQLAPELAPSPSPAPAPEEETVPPPMTGTGYGLFGHHESRQFPPSTTTTTTSASASAATISGDDENEFRGEELSQNYREETSKPYNGNNYNTNGYYTTKYNYNGNYGAGEKQGMSDTRYLENGKYYYNARNENNNYNYNNNNYYSKGNGYQQPAAVRGSSSNFGGYFGKTQYEFDSMEEYERQQGYYPQTQREFVP